MLPFFLCGAFVLGFGEERPPNILLFLADDLGVGELGAYGQRKIRTPRLDQLAREGVRFTNFYSASPVCAPARCALLTGKHTGRSAIRGNRELGGWGPGEPEGQEPLPDHETTLAELLAARSFVCGAFGKWGLGGPDSFGHPQNQGFDSFYGYLCQRVAHNHYPTHLWNGRVREVLAGNAYFPAHQKWTPAGQDPEQFAVFRGETYAPELMLDRALDFLEQVGHRPFFMYFATTVPHLALQVEDEALAEYRGRFDHKPYLGENGYLPHPEPRAAYAAMVTEMDRDFGRLLDRLAELNLERDTLVLFTSDNGPTYNGGSDSTFFDSTQGRRGRKGSLWEGGIRVPLVARWPSKIRSGWTSTHVSYFPDLFATIAEVCGLTQVSVQDGLSFWPHLRGDGVQLEHESLYWEYAEGRGEQALRKGRYKVLRRGLLTPEPQPAELYDLQADPGESTDLAARDPVLLAELLALMESQHVPHALFPLTLEEKH